MRRLTPLPRRTGCVMSKLTHQWQHQTGDEVGYLRSSKSSFPLKRQDKKSGLVMLKIRTILVQFRGSNNVDGKTRHRNAHKRRHISCSTCQLYTGRMLLQCQPTMSKHWSQGIFIRSSKRHRQTTSKWSPKFHLWQRCTSNPKLQSHFCSHSAPQSIRSNLQSDWLLQGKGVSQITVVSQSTNFWCRNQNQYTQNKLVLQLSPTF